MKVSKTSLIYLVVLVVAASVYRVIDRPMGFAPQIAIALFCGMVIKNRFWAFALPIISMFLSDVLYQVLFLAGLSSIEGFYSGQVTNYLLLASVALIGFIFRKVTVVNIIIGSLIAPTYYFLVSNFAVWMGSGGYQHPKTFAGLMQTMEDALPFYRGSLMATFFFSAIFFSVYYFVKKAEKKVSVA